MWMLRHCRTMYQCLRKRKKLLHTQLENGTDALDDPEGFAVTPFLVDFTAACIDLFRQVDVNGDGTLEWDEFSGFMMQLNHVSGDGDSICKTNKLYEKVYTQ